MNQEAKNYQEHPAWIDILSISILSLVAFFPSLDIYFLSENVSHILKSYQIIFNFDYYYYRPLYDLSLMIDHQLWGSNHIGYHISNVVFSVKQNVTTIYGYQ